MPGGGGSDAAGGLMAAVEAAAAEAPARPAAVALRHLTGGAPTFGSLAAELESAQLVGRRLQEASAAGRRLTFMASALLQRSDIAGARGAVEAADALGPSQVAAGADLWSDREQRLRLCDAAGVGNFVQASVAVRGFLSFLESGVLTPEMPDSLRIGIEDVDDERYLVGVIEAARELERYGVNRGQALDLRSIQLCLSAVQTLEQALMQFDFRNSEVRRRYDGIKYVVKKLETLAYEVDLARKRAAAAAGTDPADEPAAKRPRVEGDAVVAPRAPTAVNLKLLQEIKDRYDHFDAMREQTLKRSRDVIKGAKNAVFALQRDDFRKADTMLNQCAKDAGSIFKEFVGRSPSLRSGIFSASLEELAEALAYRAFRCERRLLGRVELQEASGLPFSFTVPEYLGGLMDLTGEVGRFAVRSAGRGRDAVGDVELCLACVDAVYVGLQSLPLLPGGLGKKMGPLKGTLAKVEGLLYELALLSTGGLKVRAPVPSFAEGEAAEAREAHGGAVAAEDGA